MNKDDLKQAARRYAQDNYRNYNDEFEGLEQAYKEGAKSDAAKQYWKSQQPIPTVDEDELWNKVGEILNGSISFSMYPKYLETLKQQFSITRK